MVLMNTINSVPGNHDRDTNAGETIKNSFAGSTVDPPPEKKNRAFRFAEAATAILGSLGFCVAEMGADGLASRVTSQDRMPFG